MVEVHLNAQHQAFSDKAFIAALPFMWQQTRRITDGHDEQVGASARDFATIATVARASFVSPNVSSNVASTLSREEPSHSTTARDLKQILKPPQVLCLVRCERLRRPR